MELIVEVKILNTKHFENKRTLFISSHENNHQVKFKPSKFRMKNKCPDSSHHLWELLMQEVTEANTLA